MYALFGHPDESVALKMCSQIDGFTYFAEHLNADHEFQQIYYDFILHALFFNPNFIFHEAACWVEPHAARARAQLFQVVRGRIGLIWGNFPGDFL